MRGSFGFASTLLDILKEHGNTCPVLLSSSIQVVHMLPGHTHSIINQSYTVSWTRWYGGNDGRIDKQNLAELKSKTWPN